MYLPGSSGLHECNQYPARTFQPLYSTSFTDFRGLVETRNVVTALEVSPSAAFKGLTMLGPAGREVEFVVAL